MRGPLPDSCLACGSDISWALSCDDSTKAGWSCTKCSAYGHANYDAPEITQGKEMAASFEGVSAMDKSITCLPTMVQLGIMRKRQESE